MTNKFQTVPEGKDAALWEIAQKRASFKGHIISYALVNTFFWVIWFFGNGRYAEGYHGGEYPWPVWPMMGWGIGLAFHFVNAYVFPKANLIENEYQHLKNKQ